MRGSAWWGKSFVNELIRISEQTEKKLKVKRGSIVDISGSNDVATPANLSQNPLPQLKIQTPNPA